MNQEEILLNTREPQSGATIYFFNNRMNEIADSNDQLSAFTPSFITFNVSNQPEDIFTFDGENLTQRNFRNNFVPLSSVTSNYLTGYTIIKEYEGEINDERKERIRNNFLEKMNLAFSADSRSYVIFRLRDFEDLHVNINLNRSYQTLDTLDVYNNLLNSIPQQESNTGVVFGRLEAVQKIEDTGGNNLKIPLKNVPIGIFQSSDQFPDSTSRDEDGNRIRLHFQNNPRRGFNNTSYFNEQSYDYDEQFLLTSTGYTSIPDHYKKFTKTNENGEFILYDVPTGSQTLLFEVDLLQQGLTKEEVALNFFDYPSSQNPNIDDVPHFFFRQIPVEILPSWGPSQSGYTELNISANIDLRKWCTYYFPPPSYREQNINELRQEGQNAKLEILVRDMTEDNFGFNGNIEDSSPVQMVEIPDPLDRVEDQELEWVNEFAQIKNRAVFRQHDYSILKLPANIYDPEKNNTNERRKNNQTPLQGVWFCGYQFKVKFINENWFRTTGFDRFGDIGSNTRDHFHLNRGNNDNTPNGENSTIEIGNFPYERPWNHLYPEPVSIPEKPQDVNAFWYASNNISTPKYVDGDLVGSTESPNGIFSNLRDSGGFGVQYNNQTEKFFSNKFSKRVSKNEVYKYENTNSSVDEYSNGYRPNQDRLNTSNVNNGEKYQRLEAGFGYFMKPEGWPFIRQNLDEDFVNRDFENRQGDFPPDVHRNEDLSLSIETGNDNAINEGGLFIYRVEDPSPQNLITPDPEITPTYVQANLNRIYKRSVKGNQVIGNNRLALVYTQYGDEGAQKYALLYPHVDNSGKRFFQEVGIKIKNQGEKEVRSPFNPSVSIPPGETDTLVLRGRTSGSFNNGSESYHDFDNGGIGYKLVVKTITENSPVSGVPDRDVNRLVNIKINFEGNTSFNTSNFKFEQANYLVQFEPRYYANQNRRGNDDNFDRTYSASFNHSTNEVPSNSQLYLLQVLDDIQLYDRDCGNERVVIGPNNGLTVNGVILGAADNAVEDDGRIQFFPSQGSVECGNIDQRADPPAFRDSEAQRLPWGFSEDRFSGY